MPDAPTVKIPDLDGYGTPQNADVLPIVDTSTDVTKKVTVQTLTELIRADALRRSIAVSLILG